MQVAATALDPTIPVLNMRDFFDPEKKMDFVNNMARAGHEVGFFALENTGYDDAKLKTAYKAFKAFFRADPECKKEMYAPHLHGQRGWVPGETAQGAKKKDVKEFMHFGRANNLYPKFMDLETPTIDLIAELDKVAAVVQKAMAIFMGLKEDFFVEQSTAPQSECLLRPLWYPKNPEGTSGAFEHTDIDDFTILPRATEKGLQVFHDNKWIDVVVPKGATIINFGDKWRNITNGYLKSSVHRVVVDPKLERRSIVYFVHPKPSDDRTPTPHCIGMTGGVVRYPQATSLELLRPRLRELGLAGTQMLIDEVASGIMERHKDLVLSGQADEPVKKTFALWESQLVQKYNDALCKEQGLLDHK